MREVRVVRVVVRKGELKREIALEMLSGLGEV
jgi:hypothetical protein